MRTPQQMREMLGFQTNMTMIPESCSENKLWSQESQFLVVQNVDGNLHFGKIFVSIFQKLSKSRNKILMNRHVLVQSN